MLSAFAIHCAPLRTSAYSASRGPIDLPGVPTNALIRWPSLAARSDTVFVAANFFQSESVTVRPAYLGRLRQTPSGELVPLPPLDLPPGNFQFAYPRIIPVGRALHLVWAEFTSPARTPQAWQLASYFGMSLWHSALDHGVWSTPERIAVADAGLGWNDEAGSVAAEANGTLHVALWVGNAGSMPHVRDLRLIADRWETSTLPYTGLTKASAIATLGDTVVVALVAEERDTARVMVMRSIDHGARWSLAHVASSRPRAAGMISRLTFATTADDLVLAIGEKGDDSPYLDTIRVLRLRESRALATARTIPPPPTADQFVLTGTSCGSLVMLTRGLSSAPHIVEITIPRDSSPIAIRPLIGGTGISVFPAIIATPRSAIAVFVYNADPATLLRSAAMTIPAC